MKFIISENRIIDIVGKFIKTIEPDFSVSNVIVRKFQDGSSIYINYVDSTKEKIIARYWIDLRELQLNTNLFSMLYKMFGDKMDVVIDWFNTEFDQHAEYVTFKFF